MCKTLENCSVCLKNETDLVNVWETDVNNVKWSAKLLTCVPEVVNDELILTQNAPLTNYL